MKQPIVTNYFGYWTRNKWVEVNPQRSLSVPCVVRVFGDGWIPINVLLFAPNPAVAEEVILEALRGCARGTNERIASDPYAFTANRAQRILDELEAGTLEIRSERFKRNTIARVAWASNDHI